MLASQNQQLERANSRWEIENAQLQKDIYDQTILRKEHETEYIKQRNLAEHANSLVQRVRQGFFA